MTSTVEQTTVVERMADWTWDAAVVGLGYTGLSLAVALAQEGIPVTGFDISSERVDSLAAGHSLVPGVTEADLAEARPLLSFTLDFTALERRDVVFVCVPTPLHDDGSPDISHVEDACRAISAILRPGHVVVLESTTYPGTTEDVVLPILEESGLELDRDFLLAHVPERLDPGNVSYRLTDIARVVGGVSPASTTGVTAVYRRFVGKVHPVADARTAELTKLVENSFRFVNIALVNEFAEMARHLGVDVREVIAAAATKPFGYMAFHPGPGVGGHCIALDPYYLSWTARRVGATPALVELAGRINGRMPSVVTGRVEEALAEAGTSLAGASVLVLGVAYKGDVPDVRCSPALECVRLLRHAGADVSYADPHVAAVCEPGLSLTAVEPTADRLAAADCVVILCDHSAVDYDLVVRHGRLVFDARGALRRRGLRGPHVLFL